jgi:hypothetical protein
MEPAPQRIANRDPFLQCSAATLPATACAQRDFPHEAALLAALRKAAAMLRFIVLLAAVAGLAAGPALAADETVASAQPQPQSAAQPAAPIVGHCWKDNVFNEYRDCVNAATRDPNAKIRMA